MSGDIVGFISIGLLLVVNITVAAVAWGTVRAQVSRNIKDISDNRLAFNSILNSVLSINTHLAEISSAVAITGKTLDKLEDQLSKVKDRISTLEKIVK